MKNIEIVKGDITTLEVDAIVNAANESLQGGAGVDGAIHAAAGPELLKECKEIGGCPTGEARLTHGHELKAKYIIHTVGPVWKGGTNQEDETLESCYIYALALALENGCKTIAFPNISTGVYGYPKIEAAIAATSAVKSFDEIEAFEKVIFCCFDEENYNIYKSIL
jgi:O-acetyl-ADP-ribose deacetylase (regulator of RNase III)